MNPTTVQKVLVSITPKDVNGVLVDMVKFPDAMTDIKFTSGEGVTVTPNDKLSAFVSSPVAGDILVTVTAVNVVGAELTDTIGVTFDQATPTVATLNVVASDITAA